jgi:transcriptional regulator with PAS, ATPase and Fis domain
MVNAYVDRLRRANEATVLVLGESGTVRVSRSAIHDFSPRRATLLFISTVQVDDTLLEAGVCTRGAFTGARPGRTL